MSRECASCHLEFRGRRSWRMVWCSIDRCYYCGKCYRAMCEPVHGTAMAARGQYRMIGIAAFVTFGSALLPFAIATVLVPPSIASPLDNRPIGLGLLALLAAGLIGVGLSLLVRRVFHARTEGGHPPVPLDTTGELPDPSLGWRPNRAAFPRRLVVLAAIIAGAIVVDAIAALWLAASGSVSYVWSVVGLSAIASAIGAVAALLAALSFTVPSQVAVAADGVHLWYESPYDRRSLRELMPWLDLNVLGMATPSGPDPATRLVRLLRIDRENARLIIAEWPRHRIVLSAPSPTTSTSAKISLSSERPGQYTSPSSLAGSAAGLAQHGTVCARCRVRFPGINGLRLLWCKVDRFYVCRKCWEDGCNEGHGRGVKAVSKPARVASGVVIAVVFFALWYPGVFYDYSLTNAWRNEPLVSISSMQAGQLVKVRGIILPGQPVAWGGHEEYFSNGGWEWFWNTTDTFFLRDVSGEILVTTENWYIIYNGPHTAPYALHTDMTMYSSGDDIQVVGTVGRFANGTLHLEAQIAAQSAYVGLITLSPSFLATASYYAIPGVILALVAAGASVLVGRRRLSRHAAEDHQMTLVESADAVWDPNLTWQPNGRGTDPRRRIRWAIVFILAGAGLLVFYPGLSPRTWWGYSSLGFVGSLVLMIEAALVYMMLFAGVGRPSYVAVDDVGFRMWYESPYDRHLSDTIFPWDEVRDIHMTSGKGAHWVLSWTTGEVTNLYMLNGRNLNLLLSEWAKRRMPTLS